MGCLRVSSVSRREWQGGGSGWVIGARGPSRGSPQWRALALPVPVRAMPATSVLNSTCTVACLYLRHGRAQVRDASACGVADPRRRHAIPAVPISRMVRSLSPAPPVKKKTAARVAPFCISNYFTHSLGRPTGFRRGKIKT